MSILLPEHLVGAADLHVHSAPDIVERRYDDVDLAREAVRAGLSALLLKSHLGSTVERAYLVSRIVPGIRTFGGLVLNDPVGGFNLAAVQVALQMGAREIWMPTKSARNHLRHHNIDGPGLSIFVDGSKDEIRPEVASILAALVYTDCILATGHLSPEEGTALIRLGHSMGLQKFLVTHPEWSVTFYPESLQKELALLGAMFERCFVSTTHRCGYTPMATITNAIADVGVESTVIATDLGQPDTPPPVEGLIEYASHLAAYGFSLDEIREMTVQNPLHLLGLEYP